MRFYYSKAFVSSLPIILFNLQKNHPKWHKKYLKEVRHDSGLKLVYCNEYHSFEFQPWPDLCQSLEFVLYAVCGIGEVDPGQAHVMI